MKLATHLHVVSRLSMNGVIQLLPLYTVMTCIEATSIGSWSHIAMLGARDSCY